MLVLLLACAHAPPAVPTGAGAATVGPRALATVSEAELRGLLAAPGTDTLVNFWASWCGPCRAELPHLDALAARHPELRVVLVNVDEPALEREALRVLDGVGLPSLRLDVGEDTSLAAALGRNVPGWSDTIPYSILLDADGSVVRWFQGSPPPTELEEVIRTALAPGSAP